MLGFGSLALINAISIPLEKTSPGCHKSLFSKGGSAYTEKLFCQVPDYLTLFRIRSDAEGKALKDPAEDRLQVA